MIRQPEGFTLAAMSNRVWDDSFDWPRLLPEDQ